MTMFLRPNLSSGVPTYLQLMEHDDMTLITVRVVGHGAGAAS